MRRTPLIMIVVLLVLLSAQPSSGALAELLMVAGGRQFELFARADLEGNGGIASFSIDLAGIESVINLSPFTLVVPEGFVGFVDRSEPDALPIFGRQPLDRPEALTYGFGQRPGLFNAAILFGIPAWGSPILLAEGTHSGLDSIQLLDAEIFVFEEEGSTNVIPAEVEFIIIPEPGTLGVVALGGAVCLVRRRRA